MKITISLILLTLLASGIACAQETKESPAKITPAADAKPPVDSSSTKHPDLNNLVRLTAGQKAPTFIATDLNGTEYNLENLRGKIVVINLWATWCVPCAEEMPELNDLVKKFKDQEVVFLAATTENKSLVENFLQKRTFSYQIIPDALQIIKQYSPKEKTDPITGKSRTIQSLPTHIIIDREGNVVKHTWGYGINKIPELSQIIEQLLAHKT